MTSWEWAQWILAALVVGNVAIAFYQLGKTGKLSRDIVSATIGLFVGCALLGASGGW